MRHTFHCGRQGEELICTWDTHRPYISLASASNIIFSSWLVIPGMNSHSSLSGAVSLDSVEDPELGSLWCGGSGGEALQSMMQMLRPVSMTCCIYHEENKNDDRSSWRVSFFPSSVRWGLIVQIYADRLLWRDAYISFLKICRLLGHDVSAAHGLYFEVIFLGSGHKACSFLILTLIPGHFLLHQALSQLSGSEKKDLNLKTLFDIFQILSLQSRNGGKQEVL